MFSSFWLAEPRANDNLAQAKTSQQKCSSAEPKIDRLAMPSQKNPARAEPKRAGSWLVPTLLLNNF